LRPDNGIQGRKPTKKAKTFKDVEVWQKSHNLVLKIYKMTRDFPRYELFGLTSQIRRSGVSIPANIVEGFKRKGNADKVRFYNIAQASLEETRYYLILANDLEYANTEDLMRDIDEVARMLDGYVRAFDK